MAEWTNALVLKTSGVNSSPGFESLSLRMYMLFYDGMVSEYFVAEILDFAFHPAYAGGGWFKVYGTQRGRVCTSRICFSAARQELDMDSMAAWVNHCYEREACRSG